MTRWRPLATVALAAVASACTFEDGRGFATLRSARLEIAFEPGARELEGETLSDLGYRARLEAFRVELAELELAELAGAGAPVEFDPANPPPGYTLCHGGHCHAEDGALVSYAEIEAELAGGGARFVAVATFPIDAGSDVLAGEPIYLEVVEPSRELPRADLRQAALTVSAVEVTGVVAGGPDDSEPVPFSIELAVGPRLSAPAELELSRDGPEELNVRARWSIDGTLFDGIDWASLAAEGAIDVEDADTPEATALLGALSESPFVVSFE